MIGFLEFDSISHSLDSSKVLISINAIVAIHDNNDSTTEVRTNKTYYTVNIPYDKVKDILRDCSTASRGE